MIRKSLKAAYYRLCHAAEKLLYRHQTPIFRQNSDKIERLRKTVKGLHTLLPTNAQYSYTILIPVLPKTDPSLLKACLQACLQQTSPSFEVLIGVDPTAGEKFTSVIEEQLSCSSVLKKIPIPEIPKNSNSVASLFNVLAKSAKNNFLVCIWPEDWIRPDFTFRFEQVARLLKNPENYLLYCDEYTINRESKTVYFKEIRKDRKLNFPYYFFDKVGRGFVCSKELWNKSGGFRESIPAGWEVYDFTLRLHQLKASFQHLPFFLYARREGSIEYRTLPVIELREFVRSLGLDWDAMEGFNHTTLRAVPKLGDAPRIHVVIPFKNQKQLTMATVDSLLKQEGVVLAITAVDNQSDDQTIASELLGKGVEVLHCNEPFNYSRLNNFAVDKTKIGRECEFVLFLNNDVELETGALLEMARWINQPGIGMVGCRLNYPDQTLQHGGVALNQRGPGDKTIWDHIEKGQSWNALNAGKQLQVVDAVTAACALMRRSTFLEIGGFDEIWYPIAFSDTNLAERLHRKGLHCFYTPYASGVHHESISRHKENIEDFESSTFLRDLHQQK